MEQLYQMLGVKDKNKINIENDRSIILKNYLFVVKNKSIVNLAPQLLSDWDSCANQGINPEYLPCSSNQKVHWECHKCGYQWKAVVYSRYKGNGCPACSGKCLVVGKNDLLSQNPKLAKEWDYAKNYPLTPQQITVNNGKKVGWICKKCDTKWIASVAHRNNGRGCPNCAPIKMIRNRLLEKRKREGSLLDNYPSIANEWNYHKNKGLKPSDFTSHSAQKVWWECQICGTEWEAYISNRVKGHGCPTCFKKSQAERSIRSALKRNGSIVVSNPEILDKWDYNKNINITPNEVTKGSHRKVWWKCNLCGNSWEAMVSNIVKGQGCPECAKQKRMKNKNKTR